MSLIKDLVKSAFRSVGADVMRVKNSPAITWLGLRAAGIQTIIDVGANTGQFGRLVSKYFPSANMFCFEPQPGPFEELKRWAASQGERVRAFNLGLAEISGQRSFHVHTEYSPSSSFLETTPINEGFYPHMRRQGHIVVPIKTLDEALSDYLGAIRTPVLLKLDVQGYEYHVLSGAAAVLKKACACLLEINLDDLYKGQADFRDLVNLFYSAGYRYAGNMDQFYAADGHVIYGDSLFVGPGFAHGSSLE